LHSGNLVSTQATNNAVNSPCDANRGWWRRLRPWIVPSYRPKSWKSRLRGILARIVFYYALIVVVMALFQRELIYRPGRAERIRLSDSTLPAGSIHDVTVTTSDGVELNGWHIIPQGLNCATRQDCDRELARANHVVLFLHGNGGDRRGREFDSLSFSRLKAHVFLFDYRGYGDNDGTPSEEGLATDARAIWNYMTSERDIPIEKIVVYGESLGGGVATRMTAGLCSAGTPPAGLVLAGTFSSMTDTASSHYPWLPVGLILLDRYESTRHMAVIDCPILQMHGAHDDIVPLSVGRRLYSAIPRQSANGVPKRFVEFTNAIHNDFEEQQFRAEIETFLKKIAESRPVSSRGGESR
jgi:pimeloyl-ACP methyl ester carboxylesterase